MIDLAPPFSQVSRKRSGFSLVELLVVMAIIGLLTTLSMTAFASLMSSNHLNEATSVIQGQLELARQTAKTLNRSVQLRLFLDQTNTTAAPSIDSLQIVVPAENSATQVDQPVEKPTLLPQSVIIADGPNDLQLTKISSSGPSLAPFNPALPANYSYCYLLTFSPAGSVAGNGNSTYPSSSNGSVYWSFSLVPQIQYRANGSAVSGMKNYATFYLNSVNGTYLCARP